MEGGLVAWLLGTARPAAVTGHSALPHTAPPVSCGKLVLKKYFPKLIPQLEIPYNTQGVKWLVGSTAP